MADSADFQQIRAEQYQRIVSTLREHVGALPRLPDPEGRLARLAAEGRDVHEIASDVRQSEEAVWHFLQNLADELAGRPREAVQETGGLGADTDPGVSGGYGDTVFGSLGNDPPVAVTEEGEAQKSRPGP